MAGDRFRPLRNRWQSLQLQPQGNSMRWILSFLLLATAAPCLAKQLADLAPRRPEPTDALETLTAEQARQLVKENLLGLSLGGLTSLSPDVARELASARTWLSLNGLKRITPEVAGELSKASCGVSLDGLDEISPQVAEQLAKLRATLELDGLTQLSLESANALAAHKGCLHLNGFVTVNDELRTAFLKHEGDIVLHRVIKNIEVLDDAGLAEVLAKGLMVQPFENLSALSVDAADALQRHAKWLCFPRLRNVSPALAERLSHSSEFLDLSGLESLEPGVAQALSLPREGLHTLNLNGLKTISASDAESLGQHKGTLTLNGLELVTPPVAQRLTKNKGGPLFLNGLAGLDADTAVALAATNRWIHLGLPEMSAETAAAIASGATLRGITFSGLQRVTPEVAERLVDNKYLVVDLPTLRATDIPPQLSAVFARAKCKLKLSGVRDLTPQLARDIGFYTSHVELTHLETLSLEQARLLSANSGVLQFPLIKSLKEDVARELSKQKGTLWFHASYVFPEFVRGLEDHEGTLRLSKPVPGLGYRNFDATDVFFVEGAFRSLVKHRGPVVVGDVVSLRQEDELLLAERKGLFVFQQLEHVSTEALKAWEKNPDVVLPPDFKNK